MELHATQLLTAPLLCPALVCDAELLLRDVTPSFLEWLTRCGPFGIGNPEPLLVTYNLTLTTPIRIIQEKHICLTLRSGDSPATLSALGWTRRTDWRRRCEDLALQPGSRIDIAYRLKEKSNPRFPGLDLELVDLRLASASNT
jgi:single-stranded-DNA-specific exonuclease